MTQSLDILGAKLEIMNAKLSFIKVSNVMRWQIFTLYNKSYNSLIQTWYFYKQSYEFVNSKLHTAKVSDVKCDSSLNETVTLEWFQDVVNS